MKSRFSFRSNNMTPTLHVAPMGSDFVVYTLNCNHQNKDRRHCTEIIKKDCDVTKSVEG